MWGRYTFTVDAHTLGEAFDLEPCPSAWRRAYPGGPAVGRAVNDGPSRIERVATEGKGWIP